MNDTVQVDSSVHNVILAEDTNVRSGFCEDRLRCSLTKVGWSMMDFQRILMNLFFDSCLDFSVAKKQIYQNDIIIVI